MNGRLSARGEHPPELEKMFEARRDLNKDAVIYLAGVVGCFICALTLTRLIIVLALRARRDSRPSTLSKPFTYTSRFLRRLVLRKVPGLPSAGHAWLCITYVGLNVTLIFEPLLKDWSSSSTWMSHIGSKTGWLAIANICVTVFLSLKNTPLGWLTGWTYESLNVFHRVVGYVTLAMVTIHGTTYAAYFLHEGNAARLRVVEEIYGIVAGFCLLTLASAGVILRRRRYELFYILHVSFFMAAMVLISLHQPDMSKNIVFLTIAGAGVWVLDRLVRGSRVLFYSYGNTATLYPLPDGGTRIVLRRAPMGAKPGQHCFIWIPKVRLVEMHPFTVVAVSPLEFVVSAHDGFTRDLHNYAVRNPGTGLRASVDGPYGKVVDPTTYDTVVMIAGGSGASYPLSLALEMHRRDNLHPHQRIVLVWAVRNQSRLQWYWDHLVTIQDLPNLTASVFVTDPTRPSSSTPISPTCEVHFSAFGPRLSAAVTTDVEKLALEPQAQPHMFELEEARTGTDSDSSSYSSPQEGQATHVHGVPIIYRRPSVSAVVNSAVGQTGADQKLLVLGCGPDGLMEEVRGVTARCMTIHGPAIDLHCEKFGW